MVCSLWPCRAWLRKRMNSILWYWQMVRQGYKPEIYQNVNQKLYVFCAIWAKALLMHIKYWNRYVSLIVNLWIKSWVDIESLTYDTHMLLLFLFPFASVILVYIRHKIILYLFIEFTKRYRLSLSIFNNCRWWVSNIVLYCWKI